MRRRSTALALLLLAQSAMTLKVPRVAVVGGGWGGWGAAKALVEAGCEVVLLDALPDPTGATPYLTPTGKPFEAGTRGFWKDYPNLNSMVRSLGLREEDVFTDFTNSSFYSPFGLEATAPVFSDAQLPTLPSPLGQVLKTFENFERLPLSDRASMVGLLYAMLDFDRDEETFAAYDRMTAHELFLRFRLSKRLVEDFLKPTLLVGLFKPPEELSAAVAMELLYFYALAHQDSFDVRWIRSGTVSSSLVKPLADRLVSTGRLDVRGGCRVGRIDVDDSLEHPRVTGLEYTQDGKACELGDIDACVLALGAKGLRGVVSSSPALSRRPMFTNAASLGGIDVCSVRLWLDKTVATRSPANVFSRFDALRGAGGTFFMLDQLQDASLDELWNGEEAQGSVVACDFYNAASVNTMTDEQIVEALTKDLLPSAVPAFKDAKVVDSYVQRYPGSVSWFSPGSYEKRPLLDGCDDLRNLKFAGDWVRMGEREHGAKGLCQERAFVAGIQAANLLVEQGALEGIFRKHQVLPVRDDEAQVIVGRAVNKRVMDALGRFNLASPWVR